MTTTVELTSEGEVSAALADALAAIDDARSALTRLPEESLGKTFAALTRLRAVAEGAALATLVEATQRGVVSSSDHPTPAGWARETAAAGGVTLTASFASDLAKAAAGADDGGMTRLMGAATAGRIGAHETAAALREFRAMRPRIPAALWDVATDTLVDYLASGVGVRRLAEAHEAIIANYGDEGEFEERARVQRRLRSFGEFRTDASGMYVATLRLDPGAHAQVAAVLDARSAAFVRPDGTTDARDRAQRRADVLVEVLTHVGTDPTALPETRPGSATRAQVVVTLTAEQLADHGRRGYATTETGQPLSFDLIDRLVCDGGLTPVVLDRHTGRPGADDEGAGSLGQSGGGGHVLDVGRRFRLATARQRTLLSVRDGGCTFPGCDRPHSWTEAHHLIPWGLGGPTDVDHLASLCARHHDVVHARHYAATVTADGVVWDLTPRPDWPGHEPPRPSPDGRPASIRITGQPRTGAELSHTLRRAAAHPRSPGEFHTLHLDFATLLTLDER
ncbi:HNH endonuclease signature motif containing protein [Agilicoccus flavus]|uniref:HNH endonuclease signature motif containing protein n=1 Tax=Agilicoccus flavus TaxID=2775968 RepID=UPI001CF64718|nr:HNH endonuclease signature motif containing protein [Agilicoccus flavus]